MKRVILGSLCLTAACSSGLREEPIANARPMTGTTGVAFGDCVEARRRAELQPDLPVDRLPAPLKQNPAVLRALPATVKRHVDLNGAIVKVNVLVDTLGRPVMRTFNIDTTSHPWLADNVKSVFPRWRFTPAELAGCKVARVYKFTAVRSKRG